MLGVEEKDPVIRGKYADDLYDEYKEVYGESIEKDEEIVYFEINNWFAGRDYPDDEIFCKWINDYQFRDDEWCKENKLCVMCGAIDMSMNYCVAAPKSWVEEHCPKLLTDEEYEYDIITSKPKINKGILVKLGIKDKFECEETRTTYKKKYSDFICHPDSDGDVYGHISGWEFPEYKEENFGVTWNDSWWRDSDEDEEEDENEQP